MSALSSHSNNLSDKDVELLSSYLDNQLPTEERVALERRLRVEPELRSELEELRAAIALLRDLPPVAPPRSFILDPSHAHTQRRPFFLSGWVQLGSALAALVLALTVTTLVFLAPAGSQTTTESVTQLDAAPTEPAAEMAAADAEQIEEEQPAQEPITAAEALILPEATDQPASETPVPAAAYPPAEAAEEAGAEGDAPAQPTVLPGPEITPAPQSQDAPDHTFEQDDAASSNQAAGAEESAGMPRLQSSDTLSPNTQEMPEPSSQPRESARSDVPGVLIISLVAGGIALGGWAFWWLRRRQRG